MSVSAFRNLPQPAAKPIRPATTVPQASIERAAPRAATVAAPSGGLHSLVLSVEHGAADALVALGRVPVLRRVGYALYGALCSGKSGGPQLENTGLLTKNLERGAQPSEAAIPSLEKAGVKTVINLRPETDWEKPLIEKAGMNYVALPLPAIGAPTNEQAVQFLKTVTDPAMGKVFFHCQHGADRTGAMAAVYRIAAQGWSADKAIAEMPKYHFHSGIEDAKVSFVKQFDGFWKGLSQNAKNDILHAVVH
ncbi:MAG TPA: dual specificity protein phosphatase family protein [Oscillatoriaceae cyanobacterium]